MQNLETHNVLIIDDLQVIKEHKKHFISFEYILRSKIDFIAENGMPTATLQIMTTVGGIMDPNRGLQKVFQAFLNGHSSFDFQIHRNIEKSEATMCRDKIHQVRGCRWIL